MPATRRPGDQSRRSPPWEDRTLYCDVRGLGADAGVVDALARLQLAARRRRSTLRLRHCSAALRELIAFMGLEDVLGD